MELWDFCSDSGRNEIQDWARKLRLTARERGQLNQKLHALTRIGFDLAHETFLAGPIHSKSEKFEHIYKLRIFSDRPLRPMLCRGPVRTIDEMTLLCGAIETDHGFQPVGAPALAVERRARVENSQGGFRKLHERF